MGGALEKMTCLWEDGVCLGVGGGGGRGVRRDHCGRQERRVEDEVRAEEAVEPEIGGGGFGGGEAHAVESFRQRSNVDGEKVVVEDLGRQMLEREVAKGKEAVFVPHRIMIKKEDLEIYGYSVGCLGCKAILRGTARQGHSEACGAASRPS